MESNIDKTTLINYLQLKGRSDIICRPLDNLEKGYNQLPPAIYKFSILDGDAVGFTNVKSPEKLINFEDGVIGESLKSLNEFFSPETTEIYREMDMAHKMGCVYHGKHGTGKTSTCMLLMQKVIELYGAIGLIGTHTPTWKILGAVSTIRRIQKNPIIIFVDEFDFSVRSEEESWLTVLDGIDSIDNSIIIGCTNHLDRIPARIKDRKSRIKELIEISKLPTSVYRRYVAEKLVRETPALLAEFAFKAEDKALTIDELKHAIIDYRLKKCSVDDAIVSATKIAPVEKKNEEE